MTRGRRAVMLLLLIVAVIGVPLTVALRWVDRTMLDTTAFVDNAEKALEKPRVQEALAQRLADAVIATEPALDNGLVRPAVESAASAAVASDAARELMRPALRELHSDLVNGEEDLDLDLDPLLKPLRAAVGDVSPEALALVPTADELPEVVVLRQEQAPELWAAVSGSDGASILAAVLTLLALSGGLAMARNRIFATALTAASAGGLCALLALALLAGERGAREGGADQVARRAIAAIGEIFGRELVTSLWITAGAAGALALITGVAAVIRRGRSEPAPA